MPTNIMVSGLAKTGASTAAKAVIQLGLDKAAKKLLDGVVTDLAEDGTAALRRPFVNRKNRRVAVQMAGQVGGAHKRVIIDGDWYWVVWLDETPFEAYPPLPEGLGPLAERRELQNYQAIFGDSVQRVAEEATVHEGDRNAAGRQAE